MDDRVSQKEDNVRAFESDVRDCKLFFYSQLENTRYRIPQGRFSFFAPSCVLGATCFTILKNSREREREIQFGLHSTNASKIREDERRRTRCIAKKKRKRKKTRNENSMDENEFKTDGSRMEK